MQIRIFLGLPDPDRDTLDRDTDPDLSLFSYKGVEGTDKMFAK
jgi:hypothetical protein